MELFVPAGSTYTVITLHGCMCYASRLQVLKYKLCVPRLKIACAEGGPKIMASWSIARAPQYLIATQGSSLSPWRLFPSAP